MKLAVVLFNLGGPDRPEAVRPFLRNLFSDPAILSVPQPFRWLLAEVISRSRAPKAMAIYAKMGGRSPILPQTEDQARALEQWLSGQGVDAKVFVAMRYWHPFAAETAAAVRAFGPDRIVALPLYPQFSTTTSASSLQDWSKAMGKGPASASSSVCCYPIEDGFVEAYADLLKGTLAHATGEIRLRVLFSAHGLPERVIRKGDPYQHQIEATAKAVAEKTGAGMPEWRVCYQSKVGPLKWIGPATDDEIRSAGRDGVGLVVLPIAFVSEHSETLVELDIEYRELAHSVGVPGYWRVPAAGTHPAFVAGLGRTVLASLSSNACYGGAAGGGRLCPRSFGQCPQPG